MAGASPKRLKKDLPQLKTYLIKSFLELTTDRNELCLMIDNEKTYETTRTFWSAFLWAHELLSRMETFFLFLSLMKDHIKRDPSILLITIDPSAGRSVNSNPPKLPNPCEKLQEQLQALNSYKNRIDELLLKMSDFRVELTPSLLL